MSLLLDALRQAERQQRQDGETSRRGGPDAWELEPVPAGAAPPAPARETHKPPAGPTYPQAAAAASRVRPSVVPPSRAVPDRNRLLPFFAGAVALACLAFGLYVYWQIQPRSGLATLPERHASAAPKAPAAPPPAGSAAAAPAAPAAIVAASPAAPASNPAPDRAREPQAFAPVLTAPPSSVDAAPSPLEIRFRRTSPAPAARDPALDAHAAFARGEFVLARSTWLQALRADPHDANALHGLAALALREGQPEAAATWYRRALEANPKDAVAHAGLSQLVGDDDPATAESRLKRLLAEQADSPHLHFALANRYAGAARWSEAQQHYFKAHVADPDNPDYLYNLAVSLDHLRQPALAERYYESALARARTHPAAFAPAHVEARLKALQAARQE